MDNRFAGPSTGSSGSSPVQGRVGGSNLGESPSPSFLFAGQSLIEATVGQVLMDFKRKYDHQVEENKRLQDEVRRLEGERASTGNENLLHQRIQQLEGRVKELKVQLTRRLDVRMEPGGDADSDVTIFEIGFEAEETQQILPTDMDDVWSTTGSGGSSPITSEREGQITAFPNGASQTSSTSQLGPFIPRQVSVATSVVPTTSRNNIAIIPRCRQKPLSPKQKVSRSKAPSTATRKTSRQPRPSTSKQDSESNEDSNLDEAQPQDTTIDHCELPKSSSGDFRCSCGKIFKVKYRLVQHINYSKGDFKFSCDSCGKRFFSPSHLKRHLRVHKQVLEPSAKAGCYGCGKMFPSVKAMHGHRRSMSCGNPQSSSTGNGSNGSDSS